MRLETLGVQVPSTHLLGTCQPRVQSAAMASASAIDCACILFCSVIALAVCLHCADRLAVRINVLSIDKHTEQTDSTMMCVQCFGMRVECQMRGSLGKLYSDVVTTTHNTDALTQSLPNPINCTGVVAFSTHTNVVTGR